MNVFILFESKNIENIKLGIQVIKSLGYQNHFERYFSKSINEYENIFENIILLINGDKEFEDYLEQLLCCNLDLTELDSNNIGWFLINHPHLFGYFDLTKIEEEDIIWVNTWQPQLMCYFDLSRASIRLQEEIITGNPKLEIYHNTYESY